jgi:hypothetical protein
MSTQVSAAGYAGSGVWALTTQGLELSTQAGSWKAITPAGVQPNLIRNADFAGASNGWVAAFGQTNGGGAPLLVYITSDRGDSWQASTVDSSQLLAQSEDGASTLTFANGSDGWLEVQTASSSNFSEANLYRTTDGGTTWTAEQIPIAGPLVFASPQNGFVSGGVTGTDLYATHDGGSSWQPVKLPGPTGVISGPVFTTPTDGLVSSTQINGASATTHVYRTSDGGATWKGDGTLSRSADQATSAAPLAGVNGGWLTTDGPGAALASMSSGGTTATTFTASGLPTSAFGAINGLDFPSGSTNGLATFEGNVCEGYKTGCVEIQSLYSTSDGGHTWSQLTP